MIGSIYRGNIRALESLGVRTILGRIGGRRPAGGIRPGDLAAGEQRALVSFLTQ
jgi:hypothetical protein